MGRTWHDDHYERGVMSDNADFPDDSDGFREYNGLPADLVYEILSVWRIDRDAYYGLREKILEILGGHFARHVTSDQVHEVERLVEEYVHVT